MRFIADQKIDTQAVGGEFYSEKYDLRHIVHAQILATVRGNNPANLVFDSADVNVTPESSIDSDSEIDNATKIAELTTTGTLPSNLLTSTTYYLINQAEGVIQIAGNRSKAIDGDPKILTSQGTGEHTIVWDTALSGTLKLQKTLGDPTDQNAVWIDVDNDEILNINNVAGFSADADINWVLRDISFTGLRVYCSVTSGTIDLDLYISGKGA